MSKILIIDDDTYICNLIVNYLKKKGFEATPSFTGNKGINLAINSKFDVVLCDYRLPDTDGFTILKEIKLKKPALPIAIMTAYAEVQMAVKLIKAGAFDYVTKPIKPEEILQLINKALNQKAKRETSATFQKKFIAGNSLQINKVMEHVKLVAPTDLTVLIEGETGAGKEYIAKAIHYSSNRSKKPFIAVDCGAIPKELANSELFGHIKGAFTGAINDKKGFFEQANGGTIFLDEVGNLLHENQVKLLRALQERNISRVGDNKTMYVDVRVITASNENLQEQVINNSFREDLFHRLNGFKLTLPPLRERGDDILIFTNHYINEANKNFNKNVIGISKEVESLFLQYSWHGNLRELQNIINRAVLLSVNDFIESDVLPVELKNHTANKLGQDISIKNISNIDNLKDATLITEKEVISNALIKTNYNKSKAAQILNIDRKTLYNKIKLYDIDASKN